MRNQNSQIKVPLMAANGAHYHVNNPPRFGLTEPISVAEPSESDILTNNKLEKFLVDSGLYESKDESIKRVEVLARLDEVVKMWVKNVTMEKGYNDQMVEESNAKIFTFGSYRLGVHGPGADIDTLCVGPRYATREEDFFGGLHNMLAEMPEVQELNPVPDAHVPVLKFKFDGVSIDLLYAKMDLWVIPEDLDLLQESVLQNVDEQTVRSLNGCRVTDQILRLVPNIQNFLLSLRCIRFWAKQRGIYSNVSGFLGGINWAILVGRIYQLYPKALPATLVSRFFRVYNQWKWPLPVMLCQIKEGSMGLSVWNPRRNPKDRQHLMPIITPAFPSMNSSYNVSSSTLRIMQQEFHRGLNICQGLETSNEAGWDSLFEPFAFFEAYKDFLQIGVAAGNDVDFRQWKGWVESRIRLLTLKIERDTRAMLHCHPYPSEFSNKSKEFDCCYFMGLKRQEGIDAKDFGPFDIRFTIQQFKYEVGRYMTWKPGMSIRVSYVKRRDLPAFVFPGGVRPSHLAKAASKRKGVAFSQADGTIDKKRRKLEMSNIAPRASTEELRTEQDSVAPNTICATLPSHTEIVEQLKQVNASGGPLSSGNSSSGSETADKIIVESSGDEVGASSSSKQFHELEGEVGTISQGDSNDQKVKHDVEQPPVATLLAEMEKANVSCCNFFEKESLEELEAPTPLVAQSCALASNVAAQKPLIRFNFTSLRGATSNCV